MLLKERLHQALRELEHLMEWQTANLVLHGKFIDACLNRPPFIEMLNDIAFAQFTWDYVSIPDKAELEAHDMFDCIYIES